MLFYGKWRERAIDNKGRITIPAEFAEVFTPGKKVVVVEGLKIVTLPLAIYPAESGTGKVMRFQPWDVAVAAMIEVDGRHRIRLFGEHRLPFQAVDLLGMGDHLEFRFRNEAE